MANMTVKELSEELEITPQGINKYLRKSGLQEQAIKDGNRFLLPDELADTVRNHFRAKSETKLETETVLETENENKNDTFDQFENEKNVSSSDAAIQALVVQLTLLQQQIEIKDKQITALTDALATANETNKALSAATAVQIAADKKEVLLAAPQEGEEKPKEEVKKGFWSRLFGL